MYIDERTNVHDEERSGPPSVVSDNLVQSERWHFTSSEFPQILALFSTNYHSYARLSRVLRKMSSENARGCAQSAKNGFGL
jgi:hypothetical protein